MNTQNKFKFLTLAAGTCLLGIFVVGCQQSAGPQANSAGVNDNSTRPALLSADAKPAAPPAKGKAQIWAETCNRCHNTRSPDTYGAREWAIVMTHMRVRGYLTGEDQRAILEFLQSQ